MKILVENSGWGNVGEAWYRISLYELLKNYIPMMMFTVEKDLFTDLFE